MRYPAVPLITHDPYFSIWSTCDHPAQDDTRHWSDAAKVFKGILRVDGQCAGLFSRCAHAPAQLLSCRVLPTRTIYEFSFNGVRLTVTFLTPALPDRLNVLARPLTYVTFKTAALDGQTHCCQLYWSGAGSLCVNSDLQQITWGRLRHRSCDLLFVSPAEQPILQKSGDLLCLDWGRWFLGISKRNACENDASCIAESAAMERCFADSRPLPECDESDMPCQAFIPGKRNIAMAAVLELTAGVERTVICACDDIDSIEHMGRRLKGYWHTEFQTFEEMLSAALDEQDGLAAACAAFDEALLDEARQTGGEKYADLCALAYRQSIAAHKLVADFDGSALFFSKENNSNGCIATVDITYPSAPLYLWKSPELLKGMLTPILQYAENRSRWHFPFAPHDLGVYPQANGQIYGGGETNEKDQMPVEECGNILLLCGALLHFHHDIAFIEKHEGILREWAHYLLDKGYDPASQLCTDDFAGHLAHNTNLSIKAILALGAWAHICQALGNKGEAKHFYDEALLASSRWCREAKDGDHYRLAFDQPGSWSQKYNLVWDRLLDLRLFPDEVAETELKFYRTRQNIYGLPLDNRKSYTKLDWIVWTACLTRSREDFDALIAPVHQWLEHTPDRVPMGDWYETGESAVHCSFRARSVVGGVFLPFLYRMNQERI